MTGPLYWHGDPVCYSFMVGEVVKVTTRAESPIAHYNIRLMGGDMVWDASELDIRPLVANDSEVQK